MTIVSVVYHLCLAQSEPVLRFSFCGCHNPDKLSRCFKKPGSEVALEIELKLKKTFTKSNPHRQRIETRMYF